MNTAKIDRHWRVAWTNDTTGKEGAGMPVMTQVEAEALAAELDRQFPYIRHWAVRAQEDEEETP